MLKVIKLALTDMVQWPGHHPAKGKVASSVPGQGSHLGCGPLAWLGRV